MNELIHGETKKNWIDRAHGPLKYADYVAKLILEVLLLLIITYYNNPKTINTIWIHKVNYTVKQYLNPKVWYRVKGLRDL